MFSMANDILTTPPSDTLSAPLGGGASGLLSPTEREAQAKRRRLRKRLLDFGTGSGLARANEYAAPAGSRTVLGS